MRTRIPDPRATWTDDDARQVLDEWRRSGATIAAFAREHGLVAERLYWWKRRLGGSGSPAARGSATTLALVPAEIVAGGSTSTALTIRVLGEVEIEVAAASPCWAAAFVAELTRAS